ncbi:putative glucuronosyltransferase PGSIP8 [Morella rubra]|uniref:Putative glucuronosyltransferase PGSIP8 n=1 Tax=Morella rubra TaxID=262757 RepID=A0A6A1VW49_9ROSI|nr:putative glucuronosyltransferase PGSIP8 [Morella rubra]
MARIDQPNTVGLMRFLLLVLAACGATSAYGESPAHRNAYATMMYMGTPRDYEFYVAIRVLLRSLARLNSEADRVVIASVDVPLRWVQAMLDYEKV